MLRKPYLSGMGIYNALNFNMSLCSHAKNETFYRIRIRWIFYFEIRPGSRRLLPLRPVRSSPRSSLASSAICSSFATISG